MIPTGDKLPDELFIQATEDILSGVGKSSVRACEMPMSAHGAPSTEVAYRFDRGCFSPSSSYVLYYY